MVVVHVCLDIDGGVLVIERAVAQIPSCFKADPAIRKALAEVACQTWPCGKLPAFDRAIPLLPTEAKTETTRQRSNVLAQLVNSAALVLPSLPASPSPKAHGEDAIEFAAGG